MGKLEFCNGENVNYYLYIRLQLEDKYGRYKH